MLKLRENGRQVRESGSAPTLDPRKFRDPERTVTGARRASVALRRLQTLWFNTGTLCNITCQNCYIESSPRNDRLLYLTRDEVTSYLDEIKRDGWGTEEIGFTGGEPFMNPYFLSMVGDCLARGAPVAVRSGSRNFRGSSVGADPLSRAWRPFSRNLSIPSNAWLAFVARSTNGCTMIAERK